MNVAEVTDKKQLLFVDDEKHILDGLKRALYPMRDEWDMQFVEGGQAALDLLKDNSIDLVVADLRMPRMDGVELLTEIRERHPHIIRMVLSGYADRFMILRCAGPAQQLLVKPCEAEVLIKAVRRAFSLRDLLQGHALQKLLSENVVLPTLPTLYGTLMKALQSPEASLSDIAAIIAKDDAMAEKMLRLINSAFYGYIQNINQAVSYLGAEAISSIALTAALYEQFLEGDYPDFDIQASYDHSISVGATAGRWITATQKNRKLSEEATMAGMTHDFGKLVLVRNRPELWHEASEWAAQKSVPMPAAEYEVMGTSHAEIGAYLLNRWGVSDNILEAVAYHHYPARSMTREKNALFAVHMANVLCHKWHDPNQDWQKGFDEKYFQQVDPKASLSQCEADAGDVK